MADQISDGELTRRGALRTLGTACASLVLGGCWWEQKGNAPPEAAPAQPVKPARDSDGLVCANTDNGRTKPLRQKLQYTEKAPDDTRMCRKCAQWVQPPPDSFCGGCKLFKGAVSPSGYCLSFAPKPPS